MQYLDILKTKNKNGFYLLLTLTIISWIVPDALPFIDEILLAYLTYTRFREL